MKKILSAVAAIVVTMAAGTYALAEEAEDSSVAVTGEDNGGNEENSQAEAVSVTAKYTVSSEQAVEDASSDDALLVKDGVRYAWSDVKSVTFTSEKEFSAEFEITDEDGNNVLSGEVSGELDVEALNLDAAKVYKSKLKLSAEETADVEVTVTMKDGATGASAQSEPQSEPENSSEVESEEASSAESEQPDSESVSGVARSGNDNENTGVALAVAPAGLAVAFVGVAAIVSKKKQ